MASLAKRWGTDVCAKHPPAQMTLDEAKTRGRGGRRPGAGRPRTSSKRRNVAHRPRSEHRDTTPVHVTMRRAANVPDFRLPMMHDEIRNSIRDSHRELFRIVQYSIQGDHLHLIVEAEDNEALENGVRGFAVRTARRLNARVLLRKGPIWADRYHRHDLKTPREVRNALVYVLANGAKHREVERGEIDPCSSARWFEGWIIPLPTPPEPSPVRPASSWLLRVGWIRVFPGYLFPSEVPKAARSKSALFNRDH